MFFINGIFWQGGLVPYIGCDAVFGEIVMLGKRQREAIFSGVIGELVGDGETDGLLQDVYGKSILTKMKLSKTRLSFTKQYTHRQDTISYSFAKGKDGDWVGTWKGEDVGEGEAKCTLTEIPKNYFQNLSSSHLPLSSTQFLSLDASRLLFCK